MTVTTAWLHLGAFAPASLYSRNERDWLISDDNAAIHIVSRDKDLAQLLVNDGDCLWDYSGNRKRYGSDIVDEYGVNPAQFPDYLGLTGDSVDCISGVPGVGPVKARELLRQFDSLEGVYLNLDKVGQLSLRGAQRLPDVLREHRELAELSKTPAARRKAIAGVRLCVNCQAQQDEKEAFSGYNRRGSKDSQLR